MEIEERGDVGAFGCDGAGGWMVPITSSCVAGQLVRVDPCGQQLAEERF